MENNASTTQVPYQDAPTSSQPSTPQSQSQPQTQRQHPRPSQHSPSSSISTIKPLPALPHESAPPTYEAYRDDPSDEPYRDDDPSDDATDSSYHDDPHADTSSPSTHPHLQSQQQANHQRPYTDISPPLTPIPTPFADDDNIPLAHLLLAPNPYPLEAPPSYAVAIRQTRSRRDTLIQYIPSPDDVATLHGTGLRAPTTSLHDTSLRSVIVDIDEETGEVLSRTDDVRHSVEKVVAMFVVAIVLLVVSGVLMWLALGSGVAR